MQQNKIISDQSEIVANQDVQIEHMETSLENETDIKENQQLQLNEQGDLKDLVIALFELVARLDFLPMIKGLSADIRVTPLSTPNMSSLTTVGTITNQANIGGWSANQKIPSLVNMNAQANINNIIVT